MSEKKYTRKQKKFNKTVDQVVEGIEKKHRGGGRTKAEDRKQERKMKKMQKTAEQISEIRAKQKAEKGPGKKGDIKIDPKNEGKFTEWIEKNMPGKDTCVAATSVMKNKKKYTTRVVKMANFAKNFACKK